MHGIGSLQTLERSESSRAGDNIRFDAGKTKRFWDRMGEWKKGLKKRKLFIIIIIVIIIIIITIIIIIYYYYYYYYFKGIVCLCRFCVWYCYIVVVDFSIEVNLLFDGMMMILMIMMMMMMVMVMVVVVMTCKYLISISFQENNITVVYAVESFVCRASSYMLKTTHLCP